MRPHLHKRVRSHFCTAQSLWHEGKRKMKRNLNYSDNRYRCSLFFILLHSENEKNQRYIMDKVSTIYYFLSKYKYLLTCIIGTAIVGFLDSNSIYQRLVLHYEIEDLKAEIEKYQKVYKNDSKQLRDLERDPKNIERIARERYFMKADDEDIYVLNIDQEEPTDNNQKTKTNEATN